MMTRINCMIIGLSLLSCSLVASEYKGQRERQRLAFIEQGAQRRSNLIEQGGLQRAKLIEQGGRRRAELIEQGWLERSKSIEQRRRLRSELIAHMQYTVEQLLREYGAV